MPTKAEILAKYKAIHDSVTKQFYKDKIIDKASFEAQHEQCWKDMQTEMLENGYMKRIYNYAFGVTITTPMGDVSVNVVITSPTQLSSAQIQNNISELKTANWQLIDSKEDVVEA